MYLSKKKLKQLNEASIYDEVLRDYGFNFHNDNPQLWTNEERLIFDIASNIEVKLIAQLNKIITSDNRNYTATDDKSSSAQAD
jgi:hypothetical protein